MTDGWGGKNKAGSKIIAVIYNILFPLMAALIIEFGRKMKKHYSMESI